MALPKFDSPIQQFLRPSIVDTTYIYIDRWSAVHFSSGLILGILFSKYFRKKYSWLIVLVLLIAYEFFEVLLTGILFVSESLIDKIWDIIIGQGGFFISYLISTKRQ